MPHTATLCYYYIVTAGKRQANQKNYPSFFKRHLIFREKYGILIYVLGVAQVVARYLGVVEAVGSSPVTQTR